MASKINSVRDLDVYQVAFDAAMKIFQRSKSFPIEEKFSLIDQIRRSSRSICSNLAEAWRKRKYKAVFLNKLSDASQEAAETQTWLEFALKCGYINEVPPRRAARYLCGISPEPTRLRSTELRRGSPRHSSPRQATGYSGEGE